MQSITKVKNLIVVGYVVAGLLLIAGAVFVTMMYLNANTKKDAKPVASAKPKLVAPAAVQKTLKAANVAAQESYDLHNSAKQAIDEKQVKLVK